MEYDLYDRYDRLQKLRPKEKVVLYATFVGIIVLVACINNFFFGASIWFGIGYAFFGVIVAYQLGK